MTEFLLVIAAIWGASGILVGIMFAIDERAHRRSTATSPAAETARPAAGIASPKSRHRPHHAMG